MYKFARVKILPDIVHVRFEQVEPSEFYQLRDKLYQAIPKAKWNRQLRWMIIPSDELNQVLNFCYQTFGASGVKVEYSNKLQNTPYQPRLSF